MHTDDMMEKCSNCPVKCGLCVAQKANHKAFCEKVDPSKKDYNPKYVEMVNHLSCGTDYQRTDGIQSTVRTIAREEIEYPSISEQGKNAIAAIGRFIKGDKDGKRFVSDEEFKRRIDICNKCVYLDREQKRCKACGCFVETKAKLITEKCPRDYWEKEEQLKEEQRQRLESYERFVHSELVNQVPPCNTCNKKAEA